MSQEYIEITERTVSEAITAACQKLAVPSERLEYEVIDPGKAGFLGIGSRAAKIRARVKQGMEDSEEFDTSAIISDVLNGKDEKKKPQDRSRKNASAEEKKEHKKNAGNKAAGARRDEEKAESRMTAAETAGSAPREEAPAEAADTAAAEKKDEMPASRERTGRFSERAPRERSRSHRRSRRFDREDRDRRDEQVRAAAPVQKKKSAVPVLTDEQIEEVKNRADTFLADVFQAMDMDAEISSKYDKETGMLTIDMKGENMGMLIGKRGQTLDSLQYLVSLVVNKGVDGYIHVKADTENYRERRKKTLENLAKNIASKVKRNRASVALEPMNPYERRIIHSALQGDRYVTTYSEGEEPYRKVIVTLKEER